MKKRKLLKLFCMSLSLLMRCGCGGPDVPENTGNDMVDEEEEELYEVDYCGQKDLFKKAEDEYEAGEKVKLYYDVIATDTDYTFYLDDEILDRHFVHHRIIDALTACCLVDSISAGAVTLRI